MPGAGAIPIRLFQRTTPRLRLVLHPPPKSGGSFPEPYRLRYQAAASGVSELCPHPKGVRAAPGRGSPKKRVVGRPGRNLPRKAYRRCPTACVVARSLTNLHRRPGALRPNSRTLCRVHRASLPKPGMQTARLAELVRNVTKLRLAPEELVSVLILLFPALTKLRPGVREYRLLPDPSTR